MSVKKRVVPELNDEFAASIREGLTAEDIKKEVRTNLHNQSHNDTHGEWIGHCQETGRSQLLGLHRLHVL